MNPPPHNPSYISYCGHLNGEGFFSVILLPEYSKIFTLLFWMIYFHEINRFIRDDLFGQVYRTRMGGVFVYCRTELLEPFECAGLFRLHAPQIRTEEPAVIVSFRDNMSPTAYFKNMTVQLKLVTLKNFFFNG